jgi:hypothetical protein
MDGIVAGVVVGVGYGRSRGLSLSRARWPWVWTRVAMRGRDVPARMPRRVVSIRARSTPIRALAITHASSRPRVACLVGDEVGEPVGVDVVDLTLAGQQRVALGDHLGNRGEELGVSLAL